LHWNGTHLVEEQTPGVDYFDVFALSATDAVALASPLVHGSPQYDEFVLLRWNGTTWEMSSRPHPAAAIPTPTVTE
jgi:hypothetical protein